MRRFVGCVLFARGSKRFCSGRVRDRYVDSQGGFAVRVGECQTELWRKALIGRFDDTMLYLAAGTVALAALVIPFLGWHLFNRIHKTGLIQKKVPSWVLVIVFLGVAAPVLAGICFWTNTPSDWMMLLVLACSFGLGIVPPQTAGIRKRYRFVAQFAVACLPLVAGQVLPVTHSYPFINKVCTVIFVMGALNLLDAINFLDGLSSLAIFIAAACAAAVLNLVTFDLQVGDPTGVVFALALCGGSLGFVLFRRPPARSEARDPASLLLGGAMCLILIRTWSAAGSEAINPAVFLPLVMVVPILLAGIYRERMSLFRRKRLAVILILLGQIPAWVPIAIGSGHYMASAILSTGSIILWTAMVAQGRILRGWPMRVIAEPIADVIRAGTLIGGASLVISLILGINAWWVLGSVALTSMLLIIQVTWWRCRLERANSAEVVVFASRDEYHRAQCVLQNCADLFGRQRTRRARIGLRSKHLRQAVTEHLVRGDTVVVLGDQVRREVLGLRVLGDLVFASDCLLLSNSDHQIDPEQPAGHFLDSMQAIAHRILAGVGLIFFAPAFLIIAILIKLEDGGPVFFRQNRLGFHGRPFTVLKFRSMRVDALAYDESPKDRMDARITRFGRFLRRTSLDELPQLINVLRGEMRLVGPRPEMPFICEDYDLRERKRLEVPPGVTGLWQVSMHRNQPIHDHVEYDLAYRLSRNPFLDTAILISTLMGGARSGY